MRSKQDLGLSVDIGNWEGGSKCMFWNNNIEQKSYVFKLYQERKDCVSFEYDERARPVFVMRRHSLIRSDDRCGVKKIHCFSLSFS